MGKCFPRFSGTSRRHPRPAEQGAEEHPESHTSCLHLVSSMRMYRLLHQTAAASDILCGFQCVEPLWQHASALPTPTCSASSMCLLLTNKLWSISAHWKGGAKVD